MRSDGTDTGLQSPGKTWRPEPGAREAQRQIHPLTASKTVFEEHREGGHPGPLPSAEDRGPVLGVQT